MDILCRAIQLNGKPEGLVIMLVTAPVECNVLVSAVMLLGSWPVTEDALLSGWWGSCCFLIPADSQWLTLTLAHFARSHHPTCILLFPLFYVCNLITLLRGHEESERLLIVFAALCLLCLFSCSPDSAKLNRSEKSRHWQDWIKSSLWMACWL